MAPKEIQISCLGYSLAADWYEEESKNILLVLVGYPSSKKSANDLVSHIAENTGQSALVLEYSGYGNSAIKLEDVLPAQHLLDVITTFDWLKKKYPTSSINVMGTSYGAYLATYLTKYREFNNLILRVPAIYLPEDFYTANKEINRDDEYMYRQNQVMFGSHPLFTSPSKLKGDTLVVAHEFDEFIPKEVSNKYIEFFKADSYVAKGFRHAFKLDAPEEDKLAYKNTISNWLKNHKRRA